MNTFENWLLENEPEVYNEFISILKKKRKPIPRGFTDEEKEKVAKLQGRQAPQNQNANQRYQKSSKKIMPSAKPSAGEVNWIG